MVKRFIVLEGSIKESLDNKEIIEKFDEFSKDIEDKISVSLDKDLLESSGVTGVVVIKEYTDEMNEIPTIKYKNKERRKLFVSSSYIEEKPKK